MDVALSDGRTIGVPLTWFPRLLDATREQLENCELSPCGLHWEELNEDISVAGLLAGWGDETKLGKARRRYLGVLALNPPALDTASRIVRRIEPS